MTKTLQNNKIIVLENKKGVMDLLKIYNTDIETDKTEEIKEFKKGSWINLVNPSENEIKKSMRKHKHTRGLHKRCIRL